MRKRRSMVSTVDLAGARWRKSSFSGGEGGGNDACVEVALSGPAAALRDSKNQAGPVLVVPESAWTSLLGHCG
ncbi:DUF397 domain-containing protein [Actinophytocola sp.]|uniref:DUF397 domain-containing protein n=1 Tax=Actinophytocola sp. TaxID=1872138 RepID=UPI003D6B5E5C